MTARLGTNLVACIAIVFIGLAMLSVPNDAFADVGDDCKAYCDLYWSADFSSWGDCMNACLAAGGPDCKADLKETDDCKKVCRVPTGGGTNCTVAGPGGCSIEGFECKLCKCNFAPKAKTPDCYCWK